MGRVYQLDHSWQLRVLIVEHMLWRCVCRQVLSAAASYGGQSSYMQLKRLKLFASQPASQRGENSMVSQTRGNERNRGPGLSAERLNEV